VVDQLLERDRREALPGLAGHALEGAGAEILAGPGRLEGDSLKDLLAHSPTSFCGVHSWQVGSPAAARPRGRAGGRARGGGGGDAWWEGEVEGSGCASGSVSVSASSNNNWAKADSAGAGPSGSSGARPWVGSGIASLPRLLALEVRLDGDQVPDPGLAGVD